MPLVADAQNTVAALLVSLTLAANATQAGMPASARSSRSHACRKVLLATPSEADSGMPIWRSTSLRISPTSSCSTTRARRPLPVSDTLRVAEMAINSSRHAAMLRTSFVLIEELRILGTADDGGSNECCAVE